jgi:hypothetical protein
MGLQLIDIGARPDDGTGNVLREAFNLSNLNDIFLLENQTGGSVPNVWYVAKNGSDTNIGTSVGDAFLTIRRAVEVATLYIEQNPTQRVCIFVKSGDYTEQNPVSMPPRCTIVGDNLRSVSVRPQFPSQDIFHVRNADYITGITFRDHVSPAAAVAYPTSGAGTITTSPYIQNCSSITTTGAGMRIDGDLALGLKSMVTDSYTQVNENGIGIHILNQAYAQLVSVFTICCSEGILVESGGYCSITNSNTSFGDLGLVARGKVSVANSGVIEGANQFGSNILVSGLTLQPNSRESISLDGGTTFYDIWEATPLSAGESVITISQEIAVPFADQTPVTFWIRSAINASSHTFEWVGTGTTLVNALPQTGAMPIQANEVVQENGGSVVFTSTDQRGDFRIGPDLTINGSSGTITGDTFDKALFAVLTPYILAIEG